MFLIYINDLPDNLLTNGKLFADDTWLFSIVHDITTSSRNLNYGLHRVRKWAFQWKKNFNPESSKQSQVVIFTLQKKDFLPLHLMTALRKKSCKQKHLEMILDFRWIFRAHWKFLLKKVYKTAAPLRKFQNILPILALRTIYKIFIRTHLDYGSINYD